MKFAKLTAVGAVLVAARSFAGGEVPAGWMEIANSSLQFSGVQGQAGWTYLFDRGEGTPSEPMPYFGTAGTHLGNQAWNALESANTYCIQYAARMHANAPVSCSAPWAGTLRPIRRWYSDIELPTRITLTGSIASNTAALRVELVIDGELVFSQTGINGANTEISFSADRGLKEILLRLDPVGNDCHADVLDNFMLRVLTTDCDANQVPDAVQLASGKASDLNGDGIPDSCQCFGDVVETGTVDGADLAAVLTVWGTNGGVYPRADTNGDGVVDGGDLATVLGSWGGCP
jgi:hypothetical protein